MSKWQPIKTAPKDGVEFLSVANYTDEPRQVQIVDWDFVQQCQPGLYTHWMPLPEPPVGERTAPSGEAVAEVTSDDEGDMLIRALRPIPLGAKLYTAPQQPAAADEFAAYRERLLRAFMMECGIIGAKEAGVNLARGIKAALAALTHPEAHHDP